MGFWSWLGERFLIISLFIVGAILLLFASPFFYQSGGELNVWSIIGIIILIIAFLFMAYAGYRGRRASWF